MDTEAPVRRGLGASGTSVRRYVLVHGSWHGRWVWERVSGLLAAAGHEVEAPDLPGRGGDRRPPAEVTLDDHVERVTEVVERGRQPAILVGHSFGGFVAAHVAERVPEGVGLLVFLAAFLLRDGQSVLEVAESVPPEVDYLEVREAEGLVVVRPEAARDAFYHDCPAPTARRAAARLVPEALAPRRTPARLTEVRFGRVPRVYLETQHDRALPLSLQRRMREALPCLEVAVLPTGHSPFLSAPGVLAGLLLRWGRAERAGKRQR